MYTIKHPHAIIAICAAELKPVWGAEVSRQYIQAANCPFSLYRLACQLKAAQQVKEG